MIFLAPEMADGRRPGWKRG